jgi:hypothetical protein
MKKENQQIQCKICNKYYVSYKALMLHVRQTHKLNAKEYYDKHLKKPEEGICPVCGKPTPFVNSNIGYQESCSLKCSFYNPKRIERLKKNSLEKYGTEYPIQSEQTKNKIKQTNLEKYGHENPFGSKIVQEKIKQTNLEKRGVEYAGKCKETRTKINKTYKERYGGHPWSNKNVQLKQRKTMKEKYGVEHNFQIDVEGRYERNIKQFGEDYYSKKAKKAHQTSKENGTHDDWIKAIQNGTKRRIHKFEKDNNCTIIRKLILEYGLGWWRNANYLDLTIYRDKNNIFVSNNDIQKIIDYTEFIKTRQSSLFEKEVLNFIQLIYKKEIIQNDKKLLNRQELDIYIPDKSLAIECNGVYWHSTNAGVPKEYHLNKTKKCNEIGIYLIHINEWEWTFKQDICKSIIKNALGIIDNKIYARKCIVKEVSNQESREFLEENHIQGNVNASYKLGLYYKDELVQLITIGKSRFKKDEYELLRMCSKLNTQVIGGFSKLLKHQPFNNLISFVDLSKFTGESYFNIGWQLLNYTVPSYSYYRGSEKLNRVSAQKHKLPKLLGDNFDPNKTEAQNMIDNGWLQVYDCGNIKMNYTKSEEN